VRTRNPYCPARRGQRGAVLVTVALTMFLLLGFIGAALDVGRLFVTKTELQTAMDACALAGAQELDQQADAITRARSAGKTASDSNRVGFQQTSWGGISAATEITFKDSAYATTTSPANSIYVQCAHTQAGIQPWLLKALTAFSGDPQFSATRGATATAVATRASAQTTCPVPVVVTPKSAGAGAPNYGYTKGDWITVVEGTPTNGYIGWANLDGSNNANETGQELDGKCGIGLGQPLGAPVGTHGTQASVFERWNSRFGIYKASAGPTDANLQPDFSGYIYTTSTWPSGRSAYDGATPAGTPAGAANFITMRQNFANCLISTSTNLSQCETAIGSHQMPSSEKNLIPGGTGGSSQHKQYGTNRRVVLVPVTVSYPGSIAGYACMFMLQPIFKADPTQLEYIGPASDAASPCTTAGLPGGSAGPLVPVLVR
jgi:Flp pilus assembly protein TadG